MHGVLELRGHGLKYQRPLKDPSILHHKNPYCPNSFSSSQQVLIRRVEYENPSYNHINREKEN